MRKNKIKVLDIFAGAGGLSEGFHQASDRFLTVAAVEKDLCAAATFSINFPKAKVFAADIEDWAQEESQKYIGKVDIVIGGPPCQGFSRLGKQLQDDVRNKLWENYALIIHDLKPKYFIMENVSNFLKTTEFKLFSNEFEADGLLSEYSFQDYKLDASRFGSPQKRIRAVIIGTRNDQKKPSPPVETHGNSAGLKSFLTVGEVFKKISDKPNKDLVLFEGREYKFEGKKFPGPFESTEMHWSRNYTELSLKRFEKIPPGGNRFDLPEELKAECWKKHTSGNSDVMGRLYLERPSVTVRTEFYKPEKGRYLHPTENRAITHYEATILQGFPITYKFVGSKTQIANQIGNAVPIKLGKEVAKAILGVFDA